MSSFHSLPQPSQKRNEPILRMGWIPTVSGRLSFSLIGCTNFPYPAKYYNKYADKQHCLVVYQKRWPRDGVFHSKFIRWLLEKINCAIKRQNSRFLHAFL